MSNRIFFKHVLAAAAVLALTACGGGGGIGGINSISEPPPPGPPPPPPPACGTPPCFSNVAIFPSLKTSTDFAVLGTEANQTGMNAVQLTTSGFAAQYDAQTGLYTLTLPTAGTGVFKNNDANTPSQTWWNGALLDGSGNPLAPLSVLKPGNSELQLTYTTLAEYGELYQSRPAGVVAFGTATAADAMPLTGSASYAALVRGVTLDGAGAVQGTASLQFDFGAGKLSGHMDPLYLDFGGLGETWALGRYDFVNTVYATGSSTFSGELANANFNQNGSFTGLFTGPSADELMARWSAPFFNPVTKQNSTMIGAWVGKH